MLEYTLEIKDTTELLEKLKSLSLEHGGAWVYSVAPFTHITTFKQYQSPSRVPDYYIDISNNRIGCKGSIVPFTRAAHVREQNRGYSDR